MKCQYVVFKAVGIIELSKWKIYANFMHCLFQDKDRYICHLVEQILLVTFM